jgi:hypothetical protein
MGYMNSISQGQMGQVNMGQPPQSMNGPSLVYMPQQHMMNPQAHLSNSFEDNDMMGHNSGQ